MQRHERSQFGVHTREPRWKWILLREYDAACCYCLQPRATRRLVHLHNAVAGAFCAAVDPEDPHGQKSTAWKLMCGSASFGSAAQLTRETPSSGELAVAYSLR